MSYPVNRPMPLAAAPVTARLTLSIVPSGPGAGLADPGAELIVNDAPSLAAANGDNAIWSAPLAALVAGTAVDLGTTSNGLVVSAIPPGVALLVDF